jgi:putative tryptophan/tyrosine transport system substrate-binding protein
MRRREFIAGLGSVAVWSMRAHAQQPAMPLIGYLHLGRPVPPQLMRSFHQGLSETGYVEGRNVAIEYRWAENQYDRLPALVADLVRRRVSVIAVSGGVAVARAAQAASATIPVVFQGAGDPVARGVVASLNRPGGNITGVTSLNTELGSKQLELLHEFVPTATMIALLVNPTVPTISLESIIRGMQAAARIRGLQLHVLHASAERDFDRAFEELVQVRAGGLVISPQPLFVESSEQLAALMMRHAVPTVSPYREFALAGGLMSYGGSQTENWRVLGAYTGRILKGEKPADLPVQQVTKIELVINMKTAKALGLTVPLALLGRADEVIE